MDCVVRCSQCGVLYPMDHTRPGVLGSMFGDGRKRTISLNALRGSPVKYKQKHSNMKSIRRGGPKCRLVLRLIQAARQR